MQAQKTRYFTARLQWALSVYPLRLRRCTTLRGYQHPLDFLYYLLELFFVLDLYEILANCIFKRSTRPLYDSEKFLAHLVFGNAILLDLVRIDESARIGTRFSGIVYVSGFTINSWGAFPDAIFIHELMHVWQYSQLGAAYIPRALQAQRSTMGYNYGGLQALRQATHISEFNLEQQGDLVMDYFLLMQDKSASWAPEASAADLALYETFIDQIRNETLNRF